MSGRITGIEVEFTAGTSITEAAVFCIEKLVESGAYDARFDFNGVQVWLTREYNVADVIEYYEAALRTLARQAAEKQKG